MYHPTTSHKLLLAAMFLAALPCLSGQLQPETAPIPSAEPPALDCFPYLLNLSDCLTFVEGGSNLTKPDPGCCPNLENLVNTQPVCLCQFLGNPGQAGISVDINRALKLPAVCNVTTPSVSLCAAIGVPVAAVSPSQVQPPSSDGVISASPSPGIVGGPSTLASKHNFKISLALFPLIMMFILF